ncbi:hypothetical protein [Pelomonas sp. Root1444]|uniref:hypothetical protein n=1 Tax=Pelomonas sp. Root1444 TaxID=1736464 RepID=UPI0007025036|nr:hypothetical protein [Pelomonas sp. Root1444]
MARGKPLATSSRQLGRLPAFAFVMALSPAAQLAWAEPSLPAMNSYGQPPFVPIGTERTAGLARTFVELLNQALDGRKKLHLDNVPRRRLELALSDRAFSGVALFLAPEFLVPAAQQLGTWSEPVMVDENLIVSVRPLNVSSLDNLNGLKLGGIAGHVYRLLGPAIADGKVFREDAQDHISNLGKLCLGRVDFVVISKSELAGTRPHVSCPVSFRSTSFPEPQVVVRRVLVQMLNDDSSKEVLDAVAAVACSQPWIQALAQYGLSTVGCRNTERPPDPSPEKGRKGRPHPKQVKRS